MIQHSDMARSFLYSCKYIYIFIQYVYVSIYELISDGRKFQDEAATTLPQKRFRPRRLLFGLVGLLNLFSQSLGEIKGAPGCHSWRVSKKHQPLDATFASSMRFLLSCRPGEVAATCDLARGCSIFFRLSKTKSRGFPILKNHVDHVQSIFWGEVPSFEIPPYKLAILESLLYKQIGNHCHSPQTVLHTETHEYPQEVHLNVSKTSRNPMHVLEFVEGACFPLYRLIMIIVHRFNHPHVGGSTFYFCPTTLH